MTAYVITTALVFAAITAAHLWRLVVEGMRLATEPDFVVTTLLCVGLLAWAVRLLARPRRG